MQDKHTQEPVAWRDGETGFVGRLKGGQHWQPLYQTLPYDHNTDAAARIAELEKQRDELLAALNEINNWLVCACIATPEDMAQSFQHMQQVADAAIASVKGFAV